MSHSFGHFSSNNALKAFTECASRSWKAWRPVLGMERDDWWKHMFKHWPPKDATPIMAIEPFGKGLFVYNAPIAVAASNGGANISGFAASAVINALPDVRAPCQLDSRPDWVQDDFVKDVGAFECDNRRWPAGTKTADMFDSATLHKPRVGNPYKSRLDGARQTESVGVMLQSRPSSPKNEKVPLHLRSQHEDQTLHPMLCLVDYRRRILGYLSKEEWEEFRKAIPALRKQLEEWTHTTPPPSEDVDKIELMQRVYMKNRRYKIATNKSCNHTGYDGHSRNHVHPHAGFQRMLRKKGYIKKAQIMGMTRSFEGRLVPTHPNTQHPCYGFFREKKLNHKPLPHGWLPRPTKQV
eukprot:g4710.t1